MDKKKMLLYAQAALCVLWAVLMAAAAVRIYSEGLAYQAQGHPEAWIYTREKAAAAIGRYLPLLLLAVITNIACVITGARDEGKDRPVADPALINLYKKEREDVSAAAAPADPRRLRLIRAAVLIIAVIFVIAGALNGSMEDMFIKAVNICSECIGLG